MLPKYTLKQLAYFIAAAETGATVRAAERYYISQSAMSAALSDFEAAMGVQLLVRRKGKGLSLTDAGRQLLPEARRLLAQAEELSSTATELQERLDGPLTVGCFEVLAPSIMPRAIAGFAQVQPGITMDFLEGSHPDLRDALATGRIELAVLFESSGLEGLDVQVLNRAAPHVLLHSEHPLAGRDGLHLRELEGEPLIFMEAILSQGFISDAFEITGVTPTVRFRSHNFDHIRALVRRGLGYTLFVQGSDPRRRQRWERGLVAVPLLDEIPSDPIVLAKVEGIRLTRRAQACWEFMRRSSPGSAARPRS